MDGFTLRSRINTLLSDTTTGTFTNDRATFEFLYEAAQTLAQRLRWELTTQSITTVADTSDYALSHDFMGIAHLDDYLDKFIKYDDGSSDDHFLTFREEQGVVYANNTDSVSLPTDFTVKVRAQASRVTGTCTSAGALGSDGEATLTDSAGDFSSVNAGDIVHNTTDNSHGYVISKTSSTVLVTALFGTGKERDWDLSDAYIIQPKTLYTLTLDPPPSTAGHTVTVYYPRRPAPVFSLYRAYNFPPEMEDALVHYAVWKYLLRDGKNDVAELHRAYFDKATRDNAAYQNGIRQKAGFKVSMKNRQRNSGTIH